MFWSSESYGTADDSDLDLGTLLYGIVHNILDWLWEVFCFICSYYLRKIGLWQFSYGKHWYWSIRWLTVNFLRYYKHWHEQISEDEESIGSHVNFWGAFHQLPGSPASHKVVFAAIVKSNEARFTPAWRKKMEPDAFWYLLFNVPLASQQRSDDKLMSKK